MCSRSQIVANQANAQKSTGPRTPRGKAVAARNALRHGLFARHLLLNGESADELCQLKTATIRRLNPRDPVELEVVERVITACWKLRRLQRFEATLFERQARSWDKRSRDERERRGLGRREAVPAEMLWYEATADFRDELSRLGAQEQKLENAMRRSLRELALLQKMEDDRPLTEFAAACAAGEQQAQQIRQNEANAVATLALAADVADVQAVRKIHAANRAEDPALRRRKRKNEAKSREQTQPSARPSVTIAAPSPTATAGDTENRESEAKSGEQTQPSARPSVTIAAPSPTATAGDIENRESEANLERFSERQAPGWPPISDSPDRRAA